MSLKIPPQAFKVLAQKCMKVVALYNVKIVTTKTDKTTHSKKKDAHPAVNWKINRFEREMLHLCSLFQ